jgi:uncharacterized membrane protein YdjX (TVP38/TMEM64 family)
VLAGRWPAPAWTVTPFAAYDRGVSDVTEVEEMPDVSIMRQRGKLVLAVVVLAIVAWFFASGTYRELDAERVRQGILDLGPWGPLVFVVGFAFLQPVGPSSHIFIVAASLVWPPPLAFVLGLAGAVGSQVTSFFFYRHVAASWARERLPKRLLAYEHRLVEQPFRTVLLLRLVTFTWHLSSILIGISRIRFAPMVTATVIGLAPTVAFDVWFLTSALNWMGQVHWFWQ